MFRHFALLSYFCSLCFHLFASNNPVLFFEPAIEQDSFLARTKTGAVLLRPDGLLWSRGAVRVQQSWPGALRGKIKALQQDPGETNYILGNDQTKWRKNVPHYRRVRRENIYPGIDIEFHEHQGNLEFDWLLAPGADPSRIVLRFDGMQSLTRDSVGALVIKTAEGDITYRAPRAFQQNNPIAAKWIVSGSEARILLAGYDHRLPLTIDPETLWLDRFGGSGADEVVGGWMEYNTYLVLVGNTDSADFESNNGIGASQTDIFVTIRDLRFPTNSGNMTIIGGRGKDRVLSVSNGIVGGETNSVDFPMIDSSRGRPLQPVYGGGASDGFLLLFHGPNIGQLSLSSYIGGSGEDRVLAVSGNWFAGETNSPDLPLANPQQSRIGGGMDGFFGNAESFRSPIFLSYWGGSGDDRLTAIHLDIDSNTLRIGGQTKSNDFPLINSNTKPLGGWDGVLMEVSSDTALVNSSGYWGGSGDDVIAGLTATADGRWALVANTTSTDIAVTNDSKSAGDWDTVVEYRGPQNQPPSFSTYFGGSRADKAIGMQFQNGELLIYGDSASLDLPVKNPLQQEYAGGDTDGFWAAWNLKGDLKEASYWGGAGRDSISFAMRQTAGDLLLAGSTSSALVPFPTTENQAMFPNMRAKQIGGNDGFVTLLGTQGVSLITAAVAKGSDVVLQLRAAGAFPQGTIFHVEIADGSKASFSESGAPVGTTADLSFPDQFYGGTSVGPLINGYAEGVTTIKVTWPGGKLEQPFRVLPLAAIWRGGKARISAIRSSRATANFDFVWRDPSTGETGPLRCAGGQPKFQVLSDAAALAVTSDSTNCGGGSFSMNAPDSGSILVNIVFPEIGITLPPLEITTVPPPALFAYGPPGLSSGLSTNLNILNAGSNAIVTSETPNLLKLQHGSNWFIKTTLSNSLSPQNGTVGLVGMANSGVAVVRVEEAGKDPVRISIPLSTPTLVIRRYEDLYLNGYFAAAQFFTRSSSVNAGDSVRMIVTSLPIGVDPRTSSVFLRESDLPASAQVEELHDNSAPTPVVFVPVLSYGTSFNYVVQPGVHYLRAVQKDFPDPSPALYKLETAPVLNGRVVLLGHMLQTSVFLNAGLKNSSVRVSSSDARVGLATSPTGPVSLALELPSLPSYSRGGQNFYLVSSTAPIEANTVIDVPIYFFVNNNTLNEIWTVRLVPSAVGINPARSTVPYGGKGGISVTTYAIDPASRETRIAQGLRRGATPIRITPLISGAIQGISGEVVLSSENPSFNFSFDTKSVGEGTITVSQPSDFQTPSTGAATTVTVTGYQWSNGTIDLAPDTLNTFRVTRRNGSQLSSPVDLEIVSEDPTKLLLSFDPLEPGQAKLNYTASPAKEPSVIYAQAIGGVPGDQVGIQIRGATSETARILASIKPMQIRFIRQPYGSASLNNDLPGKDPDFILNPTSAPLQVQLGISLATPVYLAGQNWNPPLLSLRPGGAPVEVRYQLQGDAEAGILSPTSITFREGDLTRNVRFIPIRSGNVTLVPAPGVAASPIRITITGPRLTITNLILGRELQSQLRVSILDGKPPATVTLSSEDPSKLLLAVDGKSVGTGTITIPFPPDGSAFFFAQALDGSGEIGVKASASGLPDVRGVVSLVESYLEASVDNGIPQLIAGADASARLRIYPRTLSRSGDFGAADYTLRAGRADLSIPVLFDPPGIIEAEPSIVTLRSSEFAAFTTIRAVASGSTTVRLADIPGFKPSPAKIDIKVDSLRLYASLGAPNIADRKYLLTKGLAIAGQVGLNAQAKQPVDIRVESLNPSLVQVMPSPDATPMDAVNVSAYSPSSPGRFYVIALASSGEAQIRVSSPGIDTITLTVSLTPLTLTLTPRDNVQFTNRGPVILTVSAGSAGATTLPNFSLPLTITSSNSEIAEVQLASIVLRDSLSTTFSVTPKRTGIATIQVSAPGGVTASVTVQVLEPSVILQMNGYQPNSPFIMGQFSQKSFGVAFTGYNPNGVTTVKLVSRNPSVLLVGTLADARGASEVTFTVGGSSSAPNLYLQALASSGSATVVLSAPGFSESIYQIDFSTAGITVVQPQFNSGIAVGQTGRVKYSLCETQYSLGQTYCVPVRAVPQTPAVTVETTASDPTVLQITEPKLTLNVANQDQWSFGVKVLRPGNVRVKVTAQPLSANNSGDIPLNFY